MKALKGTLRHPEKFSKSTDALSKTAQLIDFRNDKSVFEKLAPGFIFSYGTNLCRIIC